MPKHARTIPVGGQVNHPAAEALRAAITKAEGR